MPRNPNEFRSRVENSDNPERLVCNEVHKVGSQWMKPYQPRIGQPSTRTRLTEIHPLNRAKWIIPAGKESMHWSPGIHYVSNTVGGSASNSERISLKTFGTNPPLRDHRSSFPRRGSQAFIFSLGLPDAFNYTCQHHAYEQVMRYLACTAYPEFETPGEILPQLC